MIFDTHSHYNLPPYAESWQTAWQDARSAGVSKSLIVGVDLASSQKALEIAKQDEELYASIGLHPSDAMSWDDSLESAFTKMASHSKVIAIGETGLDYARVQSAELPSIREQQLNVFKKQIKLARELQKPLVIHARDAYEDILGTLQTEKLPPAIILHCMSGSLEYQKEALAMGCYCSFAGNVTYPSAQVIRDLALHTPPDRLLLETDAPFLPPQSKRGQTNAPANILETAQYLATLFQSTIEELCERTYNNAETCFQIKNNYV